MCKCCEKIKFIKSITEDSPKGIKRELKIRLTSISRRKGEKIPCGETMYKTYKLNYCQECGKKLNID